MPHTNECAFFYRVHNEQITGTQFSNQNRDREKYLCFEKISKELDNKESFWVKFWFDIQLKKAYNQLNSKNKQYNNLQFKIAEQYLRLENKINRIITKSDWQIMHGIAPSKELFNNYLNLL